MQSCITIREISHDPTSKVITVLKESMNIQIHYFSLHILKCDFYSNEVLGTTICLNFFSFYI